MSSNIHDLFGDINLHGGTISEAGFEVVESLPTENLFVGRQVVYNNIQYCYLNNQWLKIVSLPISVTEEEFGKLIDSNSLIPKQEYRIIGYTTKIAEECFYRSTDLGEYQIYSDKHPYDLIVTALSTNSVSNQAKAIHSKDDSYFSNCKLQDWEIELSLNEDISSSNRMYANRLVVTKLKDEYGNSCTWDFKNIYFLCSFSKEKNYAFGRGSDKSLTGWFSNNEIIGSNIADIKSYSFISIDLYANGYNSSIRENIFHIDFGDYVSISCRSCYENNIYLPYNSFAGAPTIISSDSVYRNSIYNASLSGIFYNLSNCTISNSEILVGQGNISFLFYSCIIDRATIMVATESSYQMKFSNCKFEDAAVLVMVAKDINYKNFIIPNGSIFYDEGTIGSVSNKKLFMLSEWWNMETMPEFYLASSDADFYKFMQSIE